MIAADDISTELLRKRWDKRACLYPFYTALNIGPEGLVLGASTLLAPMVRGAAGAWTLDLEGREERLLATLSILHQKPLSANLLKRISRAAERWAEGEQVLAHLELAYSGLPKIETMDEAWRLFCADGLLADGAEPHILMRALGLETSQLDLLKHNRDQPRVPAGNGRESGRWTSGGAGGSSAVAHPGQVMSDANPDPIKPGQQYAQSVIVKDLPSGTVVEPYGEAARALNEAPPNTRQVLQYRFFVQDDATGAWHVGMYFPYGMEVRTTLQTRGQGAGIDESGRLIRPPGSPPLPEEGSREKPRSAVRLGLINKVTGQAYFKVYNDTGQAISPVTGHVVGDQSPLAHYPIDPYRSHGPR